MSKLVGVPPTEDQIAMVDMLDQAKGQVLEGNVTTIGIVVGMKQGFASVMAGRDAGSLNLACDDLKRKILDAVTDGTAERLTRRSSILRQ